MKILKETRIWLARRVDRFVMWLRDKKRGYSDADRESLKQKYREHTPKPGGLIWVTKAELRVMCSENINYYDT